MKIVKINHKKEQSVKENGFTEIWKQHPFFTDYEGSNLGRIRRTKTSKIRKQTLIQNGRLIVSLYKCGKRFVMLVHRFICECFYGMKKELTVDHIDSNPLNNCLSNLRYLSQKDNANNINSKNKRKPNNTNSRKIKVKCTDFFNNVIGIFDSTKEAVKELNIDNYKNPCENIRRACRGEAKTACGYKWEYVKDKELNGENFKKHPYLDIEISNLGRVKMQWRGRERITYGNDNTLGYMRVCVNGKQHFVHRLVAQTFIPNLNGGTEVNHIDSNTKNNKVENLEWVSHSENMLSENTHSKTSHRVDLLDLDGNFIKTYSSISQMCLEMNFDSKCVRMCLKGKFKQHHGHTFRHHENNCSKQNLNETNKD